MTDRLLGRKVVIAGASSGIGLSTAKLCAAEGAEVVMLARGKDRLLTEADNIGSNAVPIVCDIADPSSVRDAFAIIDERFGELNALLNIAGVARIRAIEDATDDDIEYVMGVNLLGPIYTTRAATPLLRRAGGGDIVNVSSEVTDDYLPLMVLYGTSKAGLQTFSRMMGHELKADNIRVCNYVSGSTASGFGVNFTPEEVAAAYPAWEASGYLTRVAGPGMDPAWMAESFVFLLTRPPGQFVDRIHVRSFAPGGTKVEL
jgi:NAD(P)-dependent dehydrogenase (short-subunit alcohol dehydrogenase family)